MAMTLKQDEAIPASYPSADPDAIWQRVESHVAYRWTSRGVVWTVEGMGEWSPPLAPATVDQVEVWDNGAWVAFTADPSPWGGFWFPHDGPWRVTATVGAGVDCPASVLEAVTRLASYSEEIGKADEAKGQLVSNSMNLGGELQLSHRYEKNWTGKALQLSGAADLLRKYRRV